MTIGKCATIEEVRSHIDRIDRQIVALIAERGEFVMQVVKFKKSVDDVLAPQRVEQVIGKVRALALEFEASPIIVESVYRSMIAGFIDAELAEFAEKQQGS